MISQMDQIYANASITIIDASGDNAQRGLPGVSTSASRFQQRVHIGNTTILALDGGEYELKSSKWATRGWTYQEGYLSRRRLIFTPTQVLFLCAQQYAEESMYCLLQADYQYSYTGIFSNLIPNSRSDGLTFQKSGLLDHLAEYSQRYLTYAHDSVNAFIGVLNFCTRISSRSMTTILHLSQGLFADYNKDRKELRIYLDWYHKSPARRQPEFPSWTWAGWCGPVGCGIDGITLHKNHEDAQPLYYLDWEISWESGEPTAESIWDFVDRVWTELSTDTGQLPQLPACINQLQINCLIVPVHFKSVKMTSAQRHGHTDINPENGAFVRWLQWRGHPKEGAAVLRIWERIYIAIRCYLDRGLDNGDYIIGLIYKKNNSFGKSGSWIYGSEATFGCLLAKQLETGLYERVGVIPSIWIRRYLRRDPFPGQAFLDENWSILDEVRVSERERDRPFEGVGERRTIVLV
jgi:hypothetical protein